MKPALLTLGVLLLLTGTAVAQEPVSDAVLLNDDGQEAPAPVTAARDETRPRGRGTTGDASAPSAAPAVAATQTMATVDLDTTAIKGSRELPRVLYIVPWKKALPGELRGRPANSLLDEVLAPVDREVFVRQLDFYDQIHSETTEDPQTGPRPDAGQGQSEGDMR